MEHLSYLYIHFPFCRHLCNYCDFYKKIPSDQAEVRAFEAQLVDQMEELSKFLTQNDKNLTTLKTMYFGGGTPSLWGVEGATFFSQFLKHYGIKFEPEYEWTMEVNPGSWTSETLASWSALGVNRFSLGIQSLSGQFLKLLDRVHQVDDAYETLKEFKKRKVNFSVDFMLGLPHSQKYQRDILSELEDILEYAPNHLSLYILTTKDHYIHQKFLPNEEWIEREYLQVSEFLRARGYLHYEVSNFAKPGFESKHNLAYWQSQTVAALGPSASGLFAREGLRYKWAPKEARPVWEELGVGELKIERVYMRLRTNMGLNYEEEFDPKHKEKLRSICQNWEDQGLLESHSNGLVVLNSKGYLVLDSLMDQLLRYL